MLRCLRKVIKFNKTNGINLQTILQNPSNETIRTNKLSILIRRKTRTIFISTIVKNQKFLVAYASKLNLQNQMEILSRFITYMSEQRHCKFSPQFLYDSSQINILACSEQKAYSFDQQSRCYCLYGKAVSALKRKTKECESQRSYLCTQLENTIFHLFQQGNYHVPRNQSHQLDDILVNFTTPDENLDPIYLGNEVFSSFIPQPFALVMILPIALPKPDHALNFLKSTLLHIYYEQAQIINKIAYRQLFYKNSTIKGIYFIEQGEVQSSGGRIVARGWVTNGKCRSEGYGWKFKVLPFFKSIAKNEHIWKQFVNDLTLNKEYPFKMSYILGLNQDAEAYQVPEKKGRRGVKLPQIGHRSMDYGKLTQIQKVKHYDDRINDICEYKQKLFNKKSKQTINRKMTHIADSYDQKSQRRMLIKHESRQQNMLRYPSSNLTSSSENILIMSVLKKLESLTDSKTEHTDNREKRQKLKISPAKLYEKSRVLKKRRYKE